MKKLDDPLPWNINAESVSQKSGPLRIEQRHRFTVSYHQNEFLLGEPEFSMTPRSENPRIRLERLAKGDLPENKGFVDWKKPQKRDRLHRGLVIPRAAWGPKCARLC